MGVKLSTVSGEGYRRGEVESSEVQQVKCRRPAVGGSSNLNPQPWGFSPKVGLPSFFSVLLVSGMHSPLRQAGRF